MADNQAKWERRITSRNVKNCDDCLAYEALGWQKFGTLPKITKQCACGKNCKCVFEYGYEDDSPDGKHTMPRDLDAVKREVAAAKAVLDNAPPIPMATLAPPMATLAPPIPVAAMAPPIPMATLAPPLPASMPPPPMARPAPPVPEAQVYRVPMARPYRPTMLAPGIDSPESDPEPEPPPANEPETAAARTRMQAVTLAVPPPIQSSAPPLPANMGPAEALAAYNPFEDVDLSRMGQGIPGEGPKLAKQTQIKDLKTRVRPSIPTGLASAPMIGAPPLPASMPTPAPASMGDDITACSKCGASLPSPRPPYCPSCGYVFPPLPAAPGSAPVGPPQPNPAKLAAFHASLPVAPRVSDMFGPFRPPGDPAEEFERRATRDELRLAKKRLPESMPLTGKTQPATEPEEEAGAGLPTSMVSDKAGPRAGSKPKRVAKPEEPAGIDRPGTSPGGADWVHPAMGLIGDVADLFTSRKGGALARMPEGAAGSGPGTKAGGASELTPASSNKDLISAIDKLTAAVEKLIAAMERQVTAASTPTIPTPPGMVPVTGSRPQDDFERMKQVAANSSNTFFSRQDNNTVARPGPTKVGGPAQSTGMAPANVQPAATGAPATAQRQRTRAQANQ